MRRWWMLRLLRYRRRRLMYRLRRRLMDDLGRRYEAPLRRQDGMHRRCRMPLLLRRRRVNDLLRQGRLGLRINTGPRHKALLRRKLLLWRHVGLNRRWYITLHWLGNITLHRLGIMCRCLRRRQKGACTRRRV